MEEGKEAKQTKNSKKNLVLPGTLA